MEELWKCRRLIRVPDERLGGLGGCVCGFPSFARLFCCRVEVLAEGSPRPLSSVPDVTHHLVTMQPGRQSYEVSVLTAVNPQEVKLSFRPCSVSLVTTWRMKMNLVQRI